MLSFRTIIFLATILFQFTLFPSLAQQSNDVEKIPFEKMEKLNFLLGTWDTTNYAYEDNEWRKIAASSATFSTRLKGKLITEEISNLVPGGGFIVETFISYDQYRELYRLAAVDDTYGLMDIYEGDFVAGNVFQLTNLRAGTSFPLGDGSSMYFRLTFANINSNKLEFLVENSLDGGEIWTPMNKNEMVKVGQ